MATVTSLRPIIRVRGRSFMALVLQPEPPVAGWLAALDEQMAQAPALFAARPVIVDLSAVPGEGRNLAALVDDLQARDIRIIGVEGADPSWTDSETWGRPPLLGTGRPDRPVDLAPGLPQPTALAEPASPPPATSLLLDRPVRSGQSVVFEHGDVTILGSVASGAEVIAAGSVHIYGALRGRAIAGCMGSAEARVFCRRLEAELLAVAGVYATADNLAPDLRGRAVQVWLDGDRMQVTPLD